LKVSGNPLDKGAFMNGTGRKRKESSEEENYRLFFENSSDAIFFTSPDGKIYKCNNAATKLFGYTEEELCSGGRQTIQDNSDPHLQEALYQREKTGEFSGVLTYIKKNGSRFPGAVQSKYYKLKDGTVRTCTSVRDLTHIMKTEEQIAYQSMIVDNVSDAIYSIDSNTIATSWNKSAEKLYGWKAKEVIGKNLAEVLRSELTVKGREELYKTLNETGEAIIESIHYTKGDKKLIIEAHLISIKNGNGEITGYLTVNRDITTRKQMEEQLRHEKERLGILADLVSVFAKVTYDYNESLNYTVKKLAVDLGDQCVIRLVNEKGDRLIERAFWHREKECQEYLLEMFSANRYNFNESYSGETIKSAKPLLIPVVTNMSHMKSEFLGYVEKYGLSSLLFVPIEADSKILGTISMYRNKPGNPFNLDDQLFLQNVAGKIGFAITKAKLFNDNLAEISERKLAEEKIKSALKEKEVLIRELYHRTKNNMQVIYSLLGLKGATVEDEHTRTILEDMGNRIQTIALVHQKLYQSKNLSRIDLKEYITDLTKLIMESYSSSEKNVKLSLDLESATVLIDTAIPCGLIINELISNSFKHAFPNGRKGEIKVHLSRHEQDVIELRISDNGIGIPESVNLLDGDTLGIQLFRNIAEEQLNGEVHFNYKDGVSYTIKFKDVLYEERV